MSLGQKKSQKSEKAAHFCPKVGAWVSSEKSGGVGEEEEGRGLRHYAAPYCAHRPRPGLRGHKMWSVKELRN